MYECLVNWDKELEKQMSIRKYNSKKLKVFTLFFKVVVFYAELPGIWPSEVHLIICILCIAVDTCGIILTYI